MCQRANLRHAFHCRQIEFNPLTLVGARPGSEFAFQQPPVYPYQELTCPRCPSLCEGSERIDDSNGAGWQVRAPSVLAEVTPTGKRKLEKIKVVERRMLGRPEPVDCVSDFFVWNWPEASFAAPRGHV